MSIQQIKETNWCFTFKGQTELLFLKELKRNFPTVRACVLEPSSVLLDEYQKNVDRNPLPGITFDWKNQIFEKYTISRQNSFESKYHFISAIHSIYYINNLEEALRNLYDMLAPGGILLIAVISGTYDLF